MTILGLVYNFQSWSNIYYIQPYAVWEFKVGELQKPAAKLQEE